jgi:hypothetical protein
MLDKVGKDHIAKIADESIFFTTIEFVKQPVATLPTLEKWINAATHAEQILFFQDYRGVFTKLPPEVYQNLEERKGTITVLQKKVDTLVYSE